MDDEGSVATRPTREIVQIGFLAKGVFHIRVTVQENITMENGNPIQGRHLLLEGG